MARNLTQTVYGLSSDRRIRYGDSAASRELARLSHVRRKHFDSNLHLSVQPDELFHRVLHECLQEVTLSDCLVAGRYWLESLHVIQSRKVYGIGFCPYGSFAAWLDRMEPITPFPLCVRSDLNLIDNQIQTRGRWDTCPELEALLHNRGWSGCRVLDIGANIGACSVALALMGYRLMSFEPQATNADLMEASLRLNDIGTSPACRKPDCRPRHQQLGETQVGTVDLFRAALGHAASNGRVFSARSNAGMSIVFEDSHPKTCDEKIFDCTNVGRTHLATLDRVLSEDEGEPFCLAKIDVEGHELNVLRGALLTLRSRAIPVIHLEWWPPHIRQQGDDPVSLLWLLHALKYRIYAPTGWFPLPNKTGELWTQVVPNAFSWLLMRWGDIIAVADPW